MARVVDENFKGLAGAAVAGEIISETTGESAGALEFESRGPGQFLGENRFSATGPLFSAGPRPLGGDAVGADALVFDVDGRGLEDVSFDGDDVLLKEISQATGGRHYRVEDAAMLAEDINPGEVVVNKLDEMRFELGVGTFVLILVLLAGEWLMRKRRMLP